MNRWLKLAFALLLALALAVPAFTALAASADDAKDYKGTNPLYVNKQELKAYKKPDKDSKVLKKLSGADAVMVEKITKDKKWYGILIEDTKNGGQKIAWVQAKYLVDYYPQSLCPHSFGKWTVEREATCTEEGYRYRYCELCGMLDEGVLEKTGHDWSKWKVTKEATCVKKGERTRTCSVCGKKETEEFYDEHTFGSWTMTKEPTCTEKGEREHTCKVCGAVKTQALDMLPHEYEYQVITEPTDHSAGVRAKVCAVCGKTTAEESFDPEGTIRKGDRGDAVRDIQQLLVEQGYLNAGGADGMFGGGTEKALMKYQQDRNLNPDGVAWPQTIEDLQHDYGPWQIVKPMTRTESGERVRVCQGCGFEQHEAIDAGTILEKGDRGENVRAMQQIIKEVGYDAGGFDGIYGSKLDNALAGFAADNEMVVETGKVRPADVDAVVNAWLDTIPDESWKGEGGPDTPVNLALTVEPAGEPDESGITAYNWSLTNLGTQRAAFTALLLTFGDDGVDFRQDDLVMVLDGIDLKAGAGNSASGSFNVSADWGEGELSFAALAVSEADGTKWLSNTVSFENELNPSQKVVAPVASAIDVNNLPDGIYPVSFNRGDVLGGASGVFMNAVRVFTQDWYDPVDVSALKEGDTIIVEGEEVPVLSLEQTEYGLLVNEDQDARAFYLAAGEDANGYTVRGLNDLSTYTELGTTALTVDPAATFTDASDIESEPVTVGCEGIVEAMQATGIDYFVPQNTTVRVEGGKVVEINRVYVP